MTKQNGRTNGQPEGMLRSYFSVSEKAAISEETRSVRVIASTSTVDRMGRVVVQDWDLARYRANPVILWSHGDAGGYFGEVPDLDITLPIGYASDVSVEAGRLEATLNFVDEKANPLAAKVYEGIKQGSIRAVSAGWLPHDVRSELHDGEEVLVVSKNELLEISAVAIPANPEAVLAANFASLRARARPTQRHEVTHMSAKLFAALGLSADAGEDAIVASIETITAERRELLALTGTASIREAVPVVAGWRERASQYDDVAAKYAAIEVERREAEVEKTLDEGLRAGKRAIARDRAGLLKAAGANDEGRGANPASLKLIVAALPVEVQINGEPAKTPAMPGTTLTASEKARCKRNGWSEAEYAAEKARVTGAPVEKVD